METEVSSSTKFPLNPSAILADPAAHRCEFCFVHDNPVTVVLDESPRSVSFGIRDELSRVCSWDEDSCSRGAALEFEISLEVTGNMIGT